MPSSEFLWSFPSLSKPLVGMLFHEQFFLPVPHASKDNCAPQLGNAEQHMQDGCDDFEGQGPPVPEPAKQPHNDDRLDGRASYFSESSGAEDFDEECVVLGVNAIQNDGKMGPELSDDIEGT